MKKPVIVFDMDGVLIENRSSWRILHETFGTNNEDSFRSYMKGEIDDLEFMRRDIKLWLSVEPDLDRKRIQGIFNEQVATKGFVDGIRRLKESGASVFILSGGIDLLADRLCEEGDLDGAHANGLMFHDDGRLTGEGVLRVPLRDKGSILRDSIAHPNGFDPVISVGDSVVDITMFRISDLSIAFRPETHHVSDEADITINEEDLSTVIDRILEFMKERRKNAL